MVEIPSSGSHTDSARDRDRLARDEDRESRGSFIGASVVVFILMVAVVALIWRLA